MERQQNHPSTKTVTAEQIVDLTVDFVGEKIKQYTFLAASFAVVIVIAPLAYIDLIHQQINTLNTQLQQKELRIEELEQNLEELRQTPQLPKTNE